MKRTYGGVTRPNNKQLRAAMRVVETEIAFRLCETALEGLAEATPDGGYDPVDDVQAIQEECVDVDHPFMDFVPAKLETRAFYLARKMLRKEARK